MPSSDGCATVSRWSSRGQSRRRAVRSAKPPRPGEDVLADGRDDARPLVEAVEREHLQQERVDRLLLHPDHVGPDCTQLPGDPGQPLAPRAGRHVSHLDGQARGGIRRPVRLVHSRQVGGRRRGQHDRPRLEAPHDLLQSQPVHRVERQAAVEDESLLGSHHPSRETIASTTRSLALPSTSPTTSRAICSRSAASSPGCDRARSIPATSSSKSWARRNAPDSASCL